MGVGEGDVDEDALHDYEYRGAVDGDSNSGCDPMDCGVGSPSEEEETDGGPEGCEYGGDETMFLCAKAAFHDIGD